ncbi:hypothetical protein Sjap_015783 [Stephania japonica]|uniref:RING-type domain-containing protein n=1 Tax=Stephania japonica TaxID=461633 RepID=A0AAP0ILD7_9MAGN
MLTDYKFNATILRHETSRYEVSSKEQQERKDNGKAEFCFQFYIDHKYRFMERTGDDSAFMISEEDCELCRDRFTYSVKVDPYATYCGISSLEKAVDDMLFKVDMHFFEVEAVDIYGALESIVEEAKSLAEDARAMGHKKMGMDVKIKVWSDYLYDEEEMIEMNSLESDEEVEKNRFVPALRSAIDKLEKVILKMDAIKCGSGCVNCRVCLENMEIGTEVTRMPCSHIFHPNCIDEWLDRHHVCPLCKYRMPT